MIPDRSLEVLRAIVQDYIATREPVGSKALVERHQFGVSAATIRNDMAILEDEELIHAPHTSAGRVPTDKGYRLFVDRLQEVKPLSQAEKQAIEAFMLGSVDLDETLSRTVRMLSNLTNQVAMVQYPTLGKATVRHIELVPASQTRVLLILITDTGRIQQHVIELFAEIDEDFISKLRQKLNGSLQGTHLRDVAGNLNEIETQIEQAHLDVFRLIEKALLELVDANHQDKILLAGTSNLVRSESDFQGSLSPILEAIEEQVVLLKLITEMQSGQHGVSLRIGKENPFEDLAATSVVVSGYENQGAEIAKIGVIGPTRMDYAQNIAAVSAIARYLTKTLGS